MSILAFDTHKFVKELTGAGMKTEQAEVLANSYASLLTDQIATKNDLTALEEKLLGKIDSQQSGFEGALGALEDRLNARIAYAQVAAVVALSAVIVLVAFLGG